VSTISFSRAHTLPRAKVVEVAKGLASRLESEYAIQAHWKGDTLHFERPGVNGTLHLAPKKVEIEVTLGFMLSMFRDSIAREIERGLDEQLDSKLASPRRGRK
jgi:putative polyhydroxyalkanoate system protein